MTSIEWTRNADGTQGKSWNPVVGCSLASPGCTNCYAMAMAARIEAIDEAAYRKRVDDAVADAEDCDDEERIRAALNNERVISHYAGLTTPSKAGPVYNGKVALAPDHILTEPLRRKKPTTWFVNSMGDLFHEAVPDAWIDRVFAVMALCPQHTFIVLTKRSARMRAYVSRLCSTPDNDSDEVDAIATEAASITGSPCAAGAVEDAFANGPLPNVWLGVSTEDQRRADERIPDLLATPAAVRLVSAEPLLGPISFNTIDLPGLDWIIVGGESGKGARPMHPDWARSIRDQCAAADVPYFFKQWGEWQVCSNDNGHHNHNMTTNGAKWVHADGHVNGPSCHRADDKSHDSAIAMIRVGKSRAGRILDGRTHDAMPAGRQTEAV